MKLFYSLFFVTLIAAYPLCELLPIFQNKAILTIDGRTSKILVANEIAGKLFGYLNGELAGMKISELFTMKDGFKQNALLEQHIDTEGNIVMISGKVVSCLCKQFCIMVKYHLKGPILEYPRATVC